MTDRDTERHRNAIEGILREVPKGSKVSDYAMELAELWRMTKTCPKCDGYGTVDKHLNCSHSHPYEQYIYGCLDQITCGKCHGSGKILL